MWQDIKEYIPKETEHVLEQELRHVSRTCEACLEAGGRHFETEGWLRGKVSKFPPDAGVLCNQTLAAAVVRRVHSVFILRVPLVRCSETFRSLGHVFLSASRMCNHLRRIVTVDTDKFKSLLKRTGGCIL